MNEFGEPNMGNPSVRFDEGRERVGQWPCASQSDLPAYSTVAGGWGGTESQSLQPCAALLRSGWPLQFGAKEGF